MSTATLASDARRNVALFSQPALNGKNFKMYRKAAEGGAEMLVIEKMPVFRSGTFRDSMGYQHTWEPMHIQEMVRNFDHLRARGILPHVPVRKGHPSFLSTGGDIIDSVLGYHTGLSSGSEKNDVDGQEYEFLYGDYEILGPPDAIAAIQAGRWRNMSSEVGSWMSNDEAEYWPVYQGVAYVDFSAVEGLKNFASANGVGSTFSIMIDKELSVGTETASTVQVPAPPAGVPVPPVLTPPAPPAVETAPVVQHAAPAQTFEFTLPNGTKTADFAAVQAELTTLAAFKKESIESGRKMFAAQLAKDNKITAADVKGVEDFALSLSDEQFAAYTKQWETVAVNPALGVHVDGTSNHSGQNPVGGGSQVTAEEQALKDATDTVEQFRLSGMKPEQIKLTTPYAKLVAANRAPF